MTLANTASANMEAVNRRNVWRLVPILLAGYILNNIDKANLAFAALKMNKDLGFSPSVYGFGAGIFFLSYTLGQLPSNLAAHRFGARIWLSVLLIGWGFLASCSALIYNEASFYLLRILLGAAEAGYWPGVLYYMSQWFPHGFRGRAVTLVFLGSPLSNIIGFPISGVLLSLPTMLGLVSWQWLFIIEGSPAIIVGICAAIWLRNKPQDAEWLTQQEKLDLAGVLGQEARHHAGASAPKLSAALSHPLVLFFCLINALYAIGLYAVVFWSPRLIANFGGLSYIEVGLLSGLPFLCAAATLWVCGVSSDHFGDRKWHLAGMFLLTAVGLVGVVSYASPVAKMVALTIAIMGAVGQAGAQYAMFTEGLGRISATNRLLAARVALVVMCGGFGGFAAPYFVGVLVEKFGDFTYAFRGVAAILLVASTLMASARPNFLRCHRRGERHNEPIPVTTH